MPINQHNPTDNDNDDDDNDSDIDALIAARRYKQSTAPLPSSLQERTAPLPLSFNRQDDDMRDLIILSLLSRLVLDNNARLRNVRILNSTKQQYTGRHNALSNKRRQ